jgi:hypothetical protein
MTNEEREGNLYNVLYDFMRWPNTVKHGALHDVHKQLWRGRSNQLIDDALTAIAWALEQHALDFQALLPSLPKDRAQVVKYLEIAQRDLREVRALPAPG